MPEQVTETPEIPEVTAEVLCCYHCEEEIIEDNYHTINNNIVCENCYENNYITCYECGNNYYDEEMEWHNDNAYCPDCYSDLPRCFNCNQILNSNNCYGISNGESVCENCYENNYFTCYSCEEIFHHENSYSYEGEAYCEGCYEDLDRDDEDEDEDECEIIHSHNYKPAPVFHKEKWENTTFLGIELEVEGNSKYANDFLNTYDSDNEHLYLKGDGSLQGGFEIVSHPHTLLKHKAFKWNEILESLKKEGFTSHENTRCGLHIHFNRAAVGLTRKIEKINLLKLINFFYHNQEKIIKLSRRNDDQMHWCKMPTQKIKGKSEYCTTDRYQAINVCNTNTIEIRIFRGTLVKESFWTALEFVDALISFIQQQGITYIYRNTCWNNFKKFISQDKNYKNLKKRLKEKEL